MTGNGPNRRHKAQHKTGTARSATGSGFGRAVVIGSSIAGLTTARVLSDHFAQVTIIDRDQLPTSPEFRRGVPQAYHAHTLQPLGQRILERQFPGLVDELLSLGAVRIDARRESAFFKEGNWHMPKARSGGTTVACSRPLLETTIYRRLASHPKVTILQGFEAIGLRTSQNGEQVTGVWLRSRLDPLADDTVLPADLVVDASGRNSRAPEWLVSLGFVPPEEWKIDSFVGYATRIYRRPPGFDSQWKTLYVNPTPPHGSRGGIIIPIEKDRWYVTLIGVGRDYPPTDEAGFLEFARSLPTPRFYEAIKDAEPLNKPYGFRRTENRVRRYDKLPDFLEGFLVVGDAAFALNPIYAQGITAVAVGSQALEDVLQERQSQPDLKDLAQTFQNRLSEAVGRLWRLTVTKEWDWPVTDVSDNTEAIYPARQELHAAPAGVALSAVGAPA